MQKPNEAAKIIKAVIRGMCPHCSKEILVSTKSMTPISDWILKPEDIVACKNRVREVVLQLDDEERKKALLAWLDEESTIIGPDEVPLMIENLKPNETPEPTTE